MATTLDRTDSAVWIVFALVLLLLIPGILMMGFWGLGMMGGIRTGNWTGWGLGTLIGLALVFVILYFVAKAIQATPPRPAYAPYPYGMPAPVTPAADPRAILDARYAKGEITRDEYLRMRGDLERPAH